MLYPLQSLFIVTEYTLTSPLQSSVNILPLLTNNSEDLLVNYSYHQVTETYQAFIWSVIIPCTQITQNSSDNSLQKKQWLKFVSFEVLVSYTIRAWWRRQLKFRLVWRGCFQVLTDWKAKLGTSLKSDNIPPTKKDNITWIWCKSQSNCKTKKTKEPRDH